MKKEKREKQRIRNEESKGVKELLSYRDIIREIKRLEEEIRSTREVMTSIQAIKYDSVRVMGGKMESPIEIQCAKLVDLLRVWEDKKITGERKLDVIQSKLLLLETTEQAVLKLYYLEGMTIYQIADNLAYNERQVRRIKNKGLEKYESIII